MISLPRSRLEPLRDRLRAHGQRPSIVFSVDSTPPSQELLDALHLVEEWGPFVEAMYLMMAVDKRVLNVEREVLRGALAILSNDGVRTRHMEAMLDAAMRRVAEEGADKRLERVIETLRHDRARAETAVIVAAAVAAADDRVVPEESELLEKLCKGLEIEESRANEILHELEAQAARPPVKAE